MTKIIAPFMLLLFAAPAFAASPVSVVELAPYSNETSPVVTVSSAMTSAVSVSSSVITKVDTAFNAAMAAGLGANYQRAEITLQNNTALNVFCGFSSSGLTIANSFKIGPGSVWSFKFGKGVGIYCLADAGAAGTLIVGGVAWK